MMLAEPHLPATGFALTLRAENAEPWAAMQEHRFVQDIIAGRLDPQVFRRYIIFEHGFVETATLIFGHAMLKAPGFAQRRRLISVLHALAEEQLGYFSQVFSTLSLAPSWAAWSFPDAVRRFDGGMLKFAEGGSYADILAIMLAAEWMYATWCLRAGETESGGPELRRWVALHTEPGFLDGVDWLMREVDHEAAALDAAGRHRMSSLFGEALRLEIAFHSAAYEAWPIPLADGATE
jgi:thiaminase/transcriptional activator TenA